MSKIPWPGRKDLLMNVVQKAYGNKQVSIVKK